MKRFLTLLLAAAMVLSFAACGDNGTTIRNENEEDNVKKDPIAAQYLQDLAVKTADYPVLPAMPNESELDEAFSTIDYDKMGADAYEKAQEKIWEDWDARSNAYYDALKALRSKGTSYPAAFLHFTQETGTLLSAEENTVLSPANLYLAFAMLSETTDGDSRAQLLSLLGIENTVARCGQLCLAQSLRRDLDGKDAARQLRVAERERPLQRRDAATSRRAVPCFDVLRPDGR